MSIVELPSPNYNHRNAPIDILLMHYTGMQSAQAALDRLCDPKAKVSAHYVVDEDGTTYQLVDEEYRAWHAGLAYWAGAKDINAHSIGIEIVNPGHEFGYRPFPEAQMGSLIPLVSAIKERHHITRGNVVGHSDVAPARKQDPGELFNWHALARLRLALPRPTRNLVDPGWPDAGFMLALERFGYDVSDGRAAVTAFQRRFRPEMIDGEIDMECRCILLALLLPKPLGDD